MAEKQFLADAAIVDNMVQLQRKKEEGEKKGKPRSGNVDRRGGEEEEEEEEEEDAALRLWRMLYADGAGIVSRLSGGLERMITTVIVSACSAFGLTVSEA